MEIVLKPPFAIHFVAMIHVSADAVPQPEGIIRPVRERCRECWRARAAIAATGSGCAVAGNQNPTCSRYVQIYLMDSSLETTCKISHEYTVFHIQISIVLVGKWIYEQEKTGHSTNLHVGNYFICHVLPWLYYGK